MCERLGEHVCVGGWVVQEAEKLLCLSGKNFT